MKLIVEPRVISTRSDFCATKPSHSVALDWYVSHAPIVNTYTKHFNFDHHAWVNRLVTRSTMWQVYFAIKQWLFDCLSHKKGSMYVNDADQDVCISSWLLTCQEDLKHWSFDKQMQKLIEFQDPLDVTWWMYWINPNDSFSQTSAWIFEPYTNARTSDILETMGAEDMEDLIRKVWQRIDMYIDYSAEQIELDTSYSRIWWWKWWLMIEESWFYARMQLIVEWVTAFVSVKQLDQEKWKYSIGKKSPFIDFPITQLYQALNEAEGMPDIHQWRWWSDLIGWSSKKYHSALSPEEVEKIINDALEK